MQFSRLVWNRFYSVPFLLSEAFPICRYFQRNVRSVMILPNVPYLIISCNCNWVQLENFRFGTIHTQLSFIRISYPDDLLCFHILFVTDANCVHLGFKLYAVKRGRHWRFFMVGFESHFPARRKEQHLTTCLTANCL